MSPYQGNLFHLFDFLRHVVSLPDEIDPFDFFSDKISLFEKTESFLNQLFTIVLGRLETIRID